MVAIFTIIVPPQMINLPNYLLFSDFDIFNIIHTITNGDFHLNLLDNFGTVFSLSALGQGIRSGVFILIFSQFFKGIPKELEEAAMIDGCNPLQTYFHIVLPILKPTAITVAILNAMWIWNDYLLPYLVIGLSTEYKTIPVVIQMLVGSNGNRDMGAMMAMLVLAIIPIIIFYLACQKHIIEGVVAGAVKG